MCENVVVLRKFCEKSRCSPGKITQFARPPVATVGTNLNSGHTHLEEIIVTVSRNEEQQKKVFFIGRSVLAKKSIFSGIQVYK